jgi:deoxyribonuclease-2
MAGIGAIGDEGQAVDWWFIYKVSKHNYVDGGDDVQGVEYVYFDETHAVTGLKRSPNKVDKGGALYRTLAQLYEGASPDLGWFFYNDEIPPDQPALSGGGHAKGALAFDLATNTGFWLIVSTPHFPSMTNYLYPEKGEEMAQTLLCITLDSADTTQRVAKQMRQTHQPHVYGAVVPKKLAAADERVLLMQNKHEADTEQHVALPFKSKKGTAFNSISKSPAWKADFYNDLLGPVLHQGLAVETWEHAGTKIPGNETGDKHKLVTVQTINLAPLQQKIGWKNAFDHAKLAITDRDQHTAADPRYVCVGDINFTNTMQKRGGGTVAFSSTDLWSSLDKILLERTPPHPGA